MSQIFDALQKSESERAGTESALPQGAELLRRAERDAASRWDAKASSTNGGIAGIVLENEIPSIESANGAERDHSSTPATNGSVAPSAPLPAVPDGMVH